MVVAAAEDSRRSLDRDLPGRRGGGGRQRRHRVAQRLGRGSRREACRKQLWRTAAHRSGGSRILSSTVHQAQLTVTAAAVGGSERLLTSVQLTALLLACR